MSDYLTEAIETKLQKSNVGKPVYLYEIDMTKFGETSFYLVSGDEGSTRGVTWGGQYYAPWDMKMEGLEKSGVGPFPRPSFTVANVSGIFDAYMIEYRSLQGAKIRRIPTFEEFLDDGADPDPDAHLPIDEFEIVSCSNDDGLVIQWETAAPIDVDDVLVPTETANKTYCRQVYWDATSEDFTNVTCPYRGENGYFTFEGEPTEDPAEDKCNKLLTKGCVVRFGRAAELPFDACPAMLDIKAT